MASFKDSSFGKKATALGKNKLGIDSGFGELEKLKIYVEGDPKEKYKCVLNPTDLSHKFSVSISETQIANGTPPTPAVAPKTNSTEPETLSFDLLLDGTGVTGTIIDVASEINDLSKAVYQAPKTKEDKQSQVIIKWGHTIEEFKGNLESFSVSYSLFDPSGNPLRAKVSLSFVGRSSLSKLTTVKRKSNTQVVDLKEGSNLTTICKSVYNSPLTYIAVAKVNKLTNVRKLKPGTKLTLPPKKV
jgi:nucleoid-associated protein YgaU